MNNDYRPISCDFHDLLESVSTSRQIARIRFRDADGTAKERNTSIQDVFSRGGAEYLLMGTWETVRLDQLVEVDGIHPDEAAHGDAADCPLAS
jgi:Rho-binding antiterminator